MLARDRSQQGEHWQAEFRDVTGAPSVARWIPPLGGFCGAHPTAFLQASPSPVAPTQIGSLQHERDAQEQFNENCLVVLIEICHVKESPILANANISN
jgi:hypothetical protein